MSDFEVHDPRFRAFFMGNAALEKLAGGFRWAEGPVWFGDAGCLLFSDIPNNRIMRWSEPGGLSVWRQPPNYTNGHTRDREGRLVSCEHGGRRVSRTEVDGKVTVLVDRWQGKPLNSPNDVVVKSDGTIWFTDPHYGIMTDYEGDKAEQEIPCQVYRFDPQDGSLAVVCDDFACPNGLCFSPDERRLYVAETGPMFAADAPRYIRVFDVVDGTRVRGGEVFYIAEPGLADGFRADTDGNIWTSAGDGVHCLSPAGELLGKIKVPEVVANITFGGPKKNRLFICGTTSIYAVYLNRRGAQWRRACQGGIHAREAFMKVSDRRALGKSGLEVTVLGFGGVPLGNLYRACTDAEASATVHAAYDAGIRLIDTAPLYGFGMSEHRIGAAMRELPRDSWVLSTKIGRVLSAAKEPDKLDGRNFVKVAPYQPRFDYSYDGVMRSFEDSLQRLATHRIDILLIHDCDVWTHGSEEAYRARFKEVMDSGYKALAELRAAGVVKAIGVGVNEVQVCLDFSRAADFDCFLLAGRYTLLEQGALDELLPWCTQSNVSLIIGGPYNSGILATGAVPGATYNYKPAPPEVMDKVRRIEAVCERHRVPLARAALQFPLGHRQVATMIPGARSPKEAQHNVATFAAPIPADLWAELKHEKLVREDAPTP